MKPNDGGYARNALKHGVAGLNIDGCRIGTDEPLSVRDRLKGKPRRSDNNIYGASNANILPPSPKGRWPANVILDPEAAAMLDEQSGISKSHSDSGGASRFFYCAKASRSERGASNDHPTVKPLKLMRYLCELLKPPGGGAVLDPFGGSGTTALAARSVGSRWTLCERESHSCEIIERRFREIVRAEFSALFQKSL